MEPTRFSPIEKDPVTEATSKILVVEFHDLTLAVVPLIDPVTISLNIKSPIDDIDGFEIVIVGAILYPNPWEVYHPTWQSWDTAGK